MNMGLKKTCEGQQLVNDFSDGLSHTLDVSSFKDQTSL